MTPTLTKALERATEYFGREITLDSLRTRYKSKFYTRPRFYVAAYLKAQSKKFYSYPQIATIFQQGDHTTVMNGVKRAHEAWGEQHFNRLALLDWSPVSTVTHEEMLQIGLSNLHNFVNGSGWQRAGVA